MIDFILSKLGILLFAITMAALLLYFSGAIKDVFLAEETIQVSNTIAKQMKYMIESDNLCASTRVMLPRYIDIFGISDNASFSSIYYKLDISVSQVEGKEEKFIIFSMVNTKTNKLIALESLRTKSNVTLYSFDGINPSPAEILSINPTDPDKGQVVYMVKNKIIVDNKMENEIYFVNCKYDTAAVVSNQGQDAFADCYKKLSQLKKEFSNENPFYCVPSQPTALTE